MKKKKNWSKFFRWKWIWFREIWKEERWRWISVEIDWKKKNWFVWQTKKDQKKFNQLKNISFDKWEEKRKRRYFVLYLNIDLNQNEIKCDLFWKEDRNSFTWNSLQFVHLKCQMCFELLFNKSIFSLMKHWKRFGSDHIHLKQIKLQILMRSSMKKLILLDENVKRIIETFDRILFLFDLFYWNWICFFEKRRILPSKCLFGCYCECWWLFQKKFL